MESFFLLIIIVLLVIVFVTLNSKFSRLDYTIQDLKKSVDALKKTNANFNTVEKTEVVIAPPSVVPPIPKPAPIVPEVKKPDAVPLPNKPQIFESEQAFSQQLEKPAVPSKPTTPWVPKKSWWETFKENNPDLEKFIGENLINKIGVLILVLGISYFVKFAIDKDWINEPARAGIGILSGALVMAVAHKLRKNYGAFSSVLVAGAIAIFYFTIGIAFHDYHLFNQTVAFIIMVAITAFSCLVSLSYNRKEIAVLALIGGFAVPFMVSTGQGNYVVLLTYIIILDIGILALAYNRKWGIINILSYIFTVLLYGGWLYTEMQKDAPHYLGALLFGFAFYFIFILINIINNLRTKGQFSAVELTILASNTFLFYLAGMVILSAYHAELKGLFTTVLALLNLIYAYFLYKKFGLDKTAVYLLIGLTLTFITLAIPIQFEGNYITLFWAAEAVVLIWLAQKSGIVAYRYGAMVVHVLMIISLIMDWFNIYASERTLNILLNPIFITGFFSIVSLVVTQRLLRNEAEDEKVNFLFNFKTYRFLLVIIAITLGYFVGILETIYQSFDYIANSDSAAAFVVLYHLLFFAILCHFLWQQNRKQLASIFVLINIVLYTFWFANYAFAEHTDYISTGTYQRIAFFLHYASLLLVICSAYRLYKTNLQNPAFSFLKSNAIIWITAFFLVYLASLELMLHGLILSNTPVNIPELASYKIKNYETYEIQSLKHSIAVEKIADVKNQIVRTGFPILWGILAFIFLIIGIKKSNKPMRIIALTLLGVTILKLFLYDIRNASETGKIVAFILLGVLILIISFVYNKIKVLVLTNEKPDNNDPQ